MCDWEAGEPAVYGERQMAHHGLNTGAWGCVRGHELEKTSTCLEWTVKGLECSEECGLIMRIYELYSLTSHVLVT